MRRSTLRLGGMLLLVWMAFSFATPDTVEITLYLPGPVVLAGQLAALGSVALLLRSYMPAINTQIERFKDQIIEDE
jgi:hypothetical protein